VVMCASPGGVQVQIDPSPSPDTPIRANKSPPLRITGVKRSAFGRLSGRQRPDADGVEGDEERQRRGNGAPASVSRTTGPLRGTRCASSFSIPFASAPGGKAGAACLRDIPCGNVVSRWTLFEMGASTSESASGRPTSCAPIQGGSPRLTFGGCFEHPTAWNCRHLAARAHRLHYFGGSSLGCVSKLGRRTISDRHAQVARWNDRYGGNSRPGSAPLGSSCDGLGPDIQSRRSRHEFPASGMDRRPTRCVVPFRPGRPVR
jgi:hypothetical protein